MEQAAMIRYAQECEQREGIFLSRAFDIPFEEPRQSTFDGASVGVPLNQNTGTGP